ncbi:MAG TPA: acyl-CoA dehydrogenase family protein [Actinophytocola sp.]|uniref:acyl-CoA dehydrogenase family protein n=1 Tax=Actinophytocola sp. TaxID=1872138 RepID=UPI002DDD3E4E|nr:acyl-CoA dehydrogenase family protein [Actinophytocola sp.]HEV2783887.1 acyl-CoA dehydrogenase family protein [Actinophytocola sp.]
MTTTDIDRQDVMSTVATDLPTLTKKFAERADGYDRSATFPMEDFADLFAAGLHAPTVPSRYGGLGLGPLHGRTHELWQMTKAIAGADLSLGRCWEGHTNSLVLIDALGTEEQKESWFDGVVRRGEKWVAWSGEPQAPKPGEKRRFGTTVEKVANGWIINGSKVFATSATGADWAILLVDTAGPGGARNAGSRDGVLMLACQLADQSVSIDDSWWDPMGMRATVSHLVRFEDTYIPDTHRIGEPGDYLRQEWQTAFIPHYAASFLGAAETVYRYAVDYVLRQRKNGDPFVQQRIGAMAVAVETGDLWLRHVADLWDSGRRMEARIAGSRARHLAEHLALDTVDHCVRACGARSLVRPSPVERILRDLTFYVRHDNDDHILATIGRAALGEPYDPSFYKP